METPLPIKTHNFCHSLKSQPLSKKSEIFKIIVLLPIHFLYLISFHLYKAVFWLVKSINKIRFQYRALHISFIKFYLIITPSPPCYTDILYFILPIITDDIIYGKPLMAEGFFQFFIFLSINILFLYNEQISFWDHWLIYIFD